MESLLDTNKLRVLIKRKCGTQEQFADEVGLTRQYIGLILHGKRVPKLVTLYRFAEVLGVHPDVLLASRTPARTRRPKPEQEPEQAQAEQLELA